mmetsp:Transcript_70673/g.199548  ORF Transcript_70673/g.199548 Transcript_70673/m.199548 type:complete len:483 (-) Transcript_70673:45-1493(-)
MVSCADHHDVPPLVLHLLDQGVHGLLAERVAVALHQRVGLVDEEDAAQALLHRGRGLVRGLPDVSGHEVAAAHLVEDGVPGRCPAALGQLDRADLREDPPDDPRDHRLPSARVAEEAHVEALAAQGLQACLLPELPELHRAVELVHGALHGREPDELVQLVEDGGNLLLADLYVHGVRGRSRDRDGSLEHGSGAGTVAACHRQRLTVIGQGQDARGLCQVVQVWYGVLACLARRAQGLADELASDGCRVGIGELSDQRLVHAPGVRGLGHDPDRHRTERRLQDVPDRAAIAVVPGRAGAGPAVDVLLCAAARLRGDDRAEPGEGVWRGLDALLFELHLADLPELLAAVVAELEAERHARLEARIRLEERLHLLVVASEDDDDLATMILDLLDQRVDGLLAERVPAALDQGVGLVDEQDAAGGAPDRLLHLRGSLPDVASDKVAAADLLEHEVCVGRPLHNAKLDEDLPNNTGDDRLASAGVA